MQDIHLEKLLKKEKMDSPEQIVRTYYNDVYYYLCKKLGNSVDAQDVTQEVFVKFFANIDSYRERGKLKNYLLKLACNASNDLFRRSKHNVDLDEIDDIQDDTINVDEMVERGEEQEIVKSALMELPAMQRDVIVLRFYHDMPFGDIAKITNSNTSTVKSRYRQGMEKMKRILEVNFNER